MKEFRDLTALLIEPHSGMRASLHHMLTMCEITKIDHAVNAGTAIRPLQGKTYDIILCEYDLAEGQDGQQLLEDLRYHNMIPLWTIFIMVTAERSYEKVVGAAELAPTVYLLKPFTADSLLDRLKRALEKRTAFMPVYRLMEHGRLAEAVAACQQSVEKYPRYAGEFMRLWAEILVTLGKSAEAEVLYKRFVEAKPLAWAQLGLARTLFLQSRFPEAEEILTSLVAQNPRFLDAYDWLAKVHEATGQLSEAQVVLKDAVTISPHAMRRVRKLGQVALETGDADTAQESFQKVVTKAKYSQFRDPEDHVRLVKALVTKGDAEQAMAVVRDLEKSMGNLEKTSACSAISSALIHEASGDAERAAAAIAAAVAACKDSVGLSNEFKIDLAKVCLDNDMEQGAAEIMLDVMSNSADDAAMAKTIGAFERDGHKDLAERIAKESRRQVAELVSSGADKAAQGDFAGALALMAEAARKLPDNSQVIFNAAVAVLKCLEHNGWDGQLGEQARWYIDCARRLDPASSRLPPLVALYQTILKKYGILPSQVTAKPPARV